MAVVAPDLSVAAAMMGAVPLDLTTTGPLVGRADELDRLARLVGIADGPEVGGAGTVLLSGDAGIGKTRLLAELAVRADGSGWRVAVGHCLDFGDSLLPYLPFSEIFGRLEAVAPDLVAGMATHHPAVTRLMPSRRQRVGASGADSGTVDRTELFEAVHAALDEGGRDAPLLLVFEDVHWADQSTRDLLSFLFARRFEAPVSVVVSYRGEDLHRRHPLRTTAAQWARLPGVERLELAPLSDGDVRTLIHVLHPDPLRESDIHAVVERAEGNAFFTEELVAATTVSHGSFPRDLAGLLLVRLDQLDDDARHVVRVAAAAGRGVSHAVLAQVLDLDGTELEAAVRAAVEQNVLVPSGRDSYAFRHAMLGEAIYDDLLPGERVRIHAAYVRALAAETGRGSAADLARHARAAHDQVTALAASVRAGDEAMSVGGPDEALRHYELALELAAEAAPTSADEVVELTTRASAAATASGHLQKAIALVQDRLATAPVGTTDDQRARLLHALASAVLVSDLGIDALAATTEALRLVAAEPPSALRSRVLSVHARALFDRGRDEEATRWAEEALALGRQLNLSDVVADASTTLARMQHYRGDPEASRAVLEQVIDEAHASGDAGELRGLYNLAGLYYEQGRLADALDRYQRGVERAEAIGRRWAPYGLDARLLAAVVAYEFGDWDTALRITDARGQSPPALAEAALVAAAMPVLAGRGEGDPSVLAARVRPFWGTDGMLAILVAGPAIDMYGNAGDIAGAIAIHDEVVQRVSGLWQHADFQARVRLSALLLGQLAAHVATAGAGDRVELARRGSELGAAAERAVTGSRSATVGVEAVAWLARARAEHLRLRWLTGGDPPDQDELIAGWQASIEGFTRYPHAFELARSQTRLAAVLRSLGQVEAARALTDGARATARRLQAAPLLAELRAPGTTAVPRRDSVPTDQSLTPREHEVLELVAEGRSNREIAMRLYISAKTVSVHVSNILAKLDAGGRTEAVALARRRGLLAE